MAFPDTLVMLNVLLLKES